MKNNSKIAVGIALLSGCATLSSNITSGNFSYLTSDVSVSPFGSNYVFSTMLQAGNQRVLAKTFATNCDAGFGDLAIEGNGYGDKKSYKVALSGNEGQDEIFKMLCLKGMPTAVAMENRLSDSDKQRRDAAVQQYLSKPSSNRTRKNIENANQQPRQPVSVTCTTSNYSEGSYTNCKEQ